MQLRAPAKLNLFLHITGKRADGYHLLESLVVFTALADALHIEPGKTLTLKVDGEFAGAAGQADNLVLRAAKKLAKEQGAALRLVKNIPVGGGLGGGSSDAAAALQGLNDFWKLGWDEAALATHGLQLGADVPMCLAARPLMARGIGEQITLLPFALPRLHAVLVHPRLPLLTAQVYALLDDSWKERGAVMLPNSADGFVDWLREQTRNDLQRAAIAASPIVAELLLKMETTAPKPALVRMTGSGACCFALFADADDAARYAAALRARQPNWWVWTTEIQK